MNKSILKTLESNKSKMQKKKDKLRNKLNIIEKERNSIINKDMIAFFSGVETDLPNLSFDDSISYMRASTDGTPYTKDVYNSEADIYEEKLITPSERICTIDIQTSYEYKADDKFIGLSVDTFSTSDKGEFQLKRLMLVGQIANVILDFKDDMLASMNKTWNKFNKQIIKLEDDLHEASNMLKQIEDDKVDLKKMSLVEDLKKGLKITSESLPSLQVRYDWEVYSIIAAKITRMSYSGKSANLDLTKKTRVWDQKTESYKDGTEVIQVDKVRVDKIFDAFTTGYNDIQWNA